MKSAITIQIDASELTSAITNTRRMAKQVEQILISSMNRSTEMALTQVKRSLSKQMGLPVSRITDDEKGLRVARASKGRLVAEIVARSDWTMLGEFRPTQFRGGVKTSAWASRTLSRGTFIMTMPTGHVGVFKRVDEGRREKRTKISERTGKEIVYYSEVGGLEELYGPSLQREMMRFPTPEIYRDVMQEQMPKRIEHETKRVFGLLAR